jgi:hypothetical protein
VLGRCARDLAEYRGMGCSSSFSFLVAPWKMPPVRMVVRVLEQRRSRHRTDT